MNEKELEIYHANQKRKRLKNLAFGLAIAAPIGFSSFFIDIANGKTSSHEALSVILFMAVSIAIVTPLVLWACSNQHRKQAVIMPELPDSSVENNVSDERLSILPPDMLEKYNTEIIAFNFFIGFLLVVGLLSIAGIFSEDSGLKALSYLAIIFPILLLVFVFKQRRQSVEEKKLASRLASTGLIFTASGLQANIALLEGGYREILRDQLKPLAELKWNELQFISVEPARSSRKLSSPPYYKFILKTPIAKSSSFKDDVDALFVVRRPFYGKEHQIINYLKSHSGLPIELYDELR